MRKNLVSLVSGSPVVSSVALALHFEKQHKHVLRSIESLRTELPASFTEPNFGLSEYLDPTGRKLPAYNLTRDGFTLVAMGFTGKKALAWKVLYIQAFNAMEQALRNVQQPKPARSCTLITTAQRDRLRAIMDSTVQSMPEEFQAAGYREGWTRFHRNFDVSSFERLPQAHFDAACAWLTSLELDAGVRSRRYERSFFTPSRIVKPRPLALEALVNDVARYALTALVGTMQQQAA